MLNLLKKNCTLTSINLSDNSIGNEGARAIAQSLEKNCTLTSINLSDNSIGNEGAKAIAQALKTNTTLTSMDLSCTQINSNAVIAIRQVLECNRGIRDILERRDMDTKEAVINGKELEVLQQTYDQTPSSLSKYYLGVLLEAGHDDQSSDKTKSFLKILGGLLPYNLQSFPNVFRETLWR